MLHQYLSDFESFDNFSSNLEEHNKIQYQKLNLFKNDSFQQEFEIDFEQKSTNIVNQLQLSHQEVSKKESSQTVAKKIRKSSKKDRNQKDYKKNICRNILRHAIKSMNNDKDCVSYISELVDDGKLFISILNLILTVKLQMRQNSFEINKRKCNRQLEQITGFRVLREHLVQMKEDSQIVRNRKQAFRQYLLWYLKQKATAMILRGETQNPQEYIRYKNEVLMYYIHRPHEWMSNYPEWLNVATTGNEYVFEMSWDNCEIIDAWPHTTENEDT